MGLGYVRIGLGHGIIQFSKCIFGIIYVVGFVHIILRERVPAAPQEILHGVQSLHGPQLEPESVIDD